METLQIELSLRSGDVPRAHCPAKLFTVTHDSDFLRVYSQHQQYWQNVLFDRPHQQGSWGTLYFFTISQRMKSAAMDMTPGHFWDENGLDKSMTNGRLPTGGGEQDVIVLKRGWGL